MPFMVSVNRFVWRFGIPALVVAYGGYLVWEYSSQSDGGRIAIMREHLSNIAELDHVDALVFGGSNSVFSLSADQLEELSGMVWYNASLLNEGFSDENYRGWVEDVAGELDQTQVRLVVYSTILPFRANRFDERNDFDGDITGHLPLAIKPRVSAWSFLTQTVFEGGVLKSKEFPLPTRSGDLDFEQFDCGELPQEGQFFEQDNVAASARSIANMTAFFEATFPNAEVVIALPSEYYTRPEDIARHDAFVRSVFTEVKEDFAEMESVEPGRVKLVKQPPFPRFELVCDSRHHANQIGRAFRTQDLFARLDAS
ncbi:MAG: hypothetical protein KKC43_10055 [Alphaproteobacteria bacterium]|nr:hypothetical protein [Alphaproteobacteria bacterium]